VPASWHILREHCYILTEHCYILTEHCYILTEHCYILTEHCYILTEHLYTDRTLLYTDRTLLYTDRTLLYTERTLLYTDRTLLYTDRTLLYTDRTLLYTLHLYFFNSEFKNEYRCEICKNKHGNAIPVWLTMYWYVPTLQVRKSKHVSKTFQMFTRGICKTVSRLMTGSESGCNRIILVEQCLQ